MRFDEFADEDGGVFAEYAIVRTEGGEEVAVNVEFTDDFSFCEDGNDDFGFRFERAGEIARVLVHVVHNDGLAAGCGGATDALIQRDARVRRHAAAKRAEDQHVGIFFVDHVKANPVIAG